jgi:hypothetical protein
MSLAFLEQPILNLPSAYPGRHWELDTNFDTLVNSFVAAKP